MEVKFIPSEIPGETAIVVGHHRIEFEPGVIIGTNTDALRECLDEKCAGLTSNHKIGGLTTEESLVLSLLQHYSSCYWLKSLDYASLAVMKGFDWLDESTWNKFRATLVLSEEICPQQVGELWGRFHHFWIQHYSKSKRNPEIICFGFNQVFKLSLSSTHPTTVQPPPTSTKYILWYDGVTKCFDAITCLSNFYQDTASYWDFLMLRVKSSLDQFFERQFDALSDEMLESRFARLIDEVKSIGNEFDSFKRQFRKWKIGKEFDHLVLDMDNCIQSPDEDSKDSASAWCEQLCQVTTRCLADQIEQAFIDRKRKIEMNRRETNSEIDKIQENIESLHAEIGETRRRINEIDHHLSGKLYFNQLLLDLYNPAFVPDYNLACERKNHEIYQEKNASQLAVKIFGLIHPPSPANQEKRAALKKYVDNQANKDEVLKELHSALDNFIGQRISNGRPDNQVLTIKGEASVVLNKIASSVKLDRLQKIVINAQRVIYVDCDWTVPGISVTLVAPLIRVVSATGEEKRTITTSGRDGKEHESPKAADGNGAGASGSHGQAGEDGEHAGNVRIDCQSFTGHLKIVARGGKGADGQDGGDGQPGHKGSDGSDGTFPSDQAEGSTWYCFDPKYLHKNKGWPGSKGGNGGSGGNGGTGGRGGLGGLVEITVSQSCVTNLIERDCGDGKKGKNGNPGRGAEGGSGGKHGQDAFLYFEPDKWWPSIVNTGQWRRHKGSRTNLEKVCLQNRIIGYKIRGGISSNIQHAAEGKRGTEGKEAADHLQQRHRSFNATDDVAASQFHSLHKTGKQDDGEQEWENRKEAIRSGERRRANEAESIDRMSRDIVGGQNAISRHEEAMAIDRRRLEHMNEIHQRVRSKIQETFEQRITQQAVVGQRITRQQKLNFKDDELVLAADASSSVSSTGDPGTNIRSGRPVPEQSTAALRCLAKVDDLIKSLMMSKDNNKNLLTISQTVQALVLNLSLDGHENEWNSIEKMITQNLETNDPLKWVNSLEFVVSNLPLITSLADQTPASGNLIQALEKCLAAEDQEAKEMKDFICVLSQQLPILKVAHSFPVLHLSGKIRERLEQSEKNSPKTGRKSREQGIFFGKFFLSALKTMGKFFSFFPDFTWQKSGQPLGPITVHQVLALLRDITDWTQQSHILLGLFLDKWMLSSITKTIFQVSGGNEELGQSRASLFTTVWLQCSLVSKKWTKSTAVVQSLAENEWFQHVGQFVSQLEVLRHNENSILVDELLVKFAQDRLGLIRNVSEITVEKRWQLVFVVDHFQPKVDEMDAIGQWARKNSDRHFMAYVEKAFSERFIAPLWSEIQSLLKSNLLEDANSGKVNEDIREAINRLEAAILSSFTNLSFNTRWKLACDLKEKLDVSPFKKELFFDWIKHQSTVELTELFLPNKNNADDEVKIILSLLGDSNNLKEKSLELHCRLSYLSDASFEPSQIVKIAGILLNESMDNLTDDFNNYHWQCFRSIFLENWSDYFLSHWSKCHQQTERLRDRVAGRKPEDDDRSLNSLELALERYLLFTTSLPPHEAVDKWLKLQELSSLQDRIKYIDRDLKYAIQEIESTITPRINQLYSCKLLHLTNTEKYFFKDIVGLMDLLFEIISGAPVSFYDDTHSVRSLLDVIEATQMMMDLIADDFKNRQSEVISPAKLGEWKKKLVQWKVIDREAASAIHLAVKELFEDVESRSSSGDDCSRKIYEHIAARRRNMLHTFDQALSWLETFVGYLADSRSSIDTFKVIKATVETSQFLSWNELKSGKTSLVQVAIDISAACNLIPKPVENSWNWFFGAILNLNISEKATFLVTTLANFVGGQLSNERERADWTEVKSWFDRLDFLINDMTIDYTFRAANTNHWEEMMRIQQVLIDYCSACYETKLLTDCEKHLKNKPELSFVCFTFKNTVERLTHIVRFMQPSKKPSSSPEFLRNQLGTRQLVLKALIQLGQSDSFYWDEETVHRFLKDFLFPEFKSSHDELCILSNMLVSGPRKAFIERWISLESCREPERIPLLANSLQDKNHSLNDAQLFFSIDGYDIFNDEEKSYIKLIDDNSAVESSLLIDDQHPSCFLDALQKLAIERVRAEFVRCFEPSITVQDMDRYLPKPSKDGTLYSQGALVDKQHVTQLCRSFNRLIRTKNEQGEELLDWLHWIRDVVVPSLKSYEANQGLSVHQITKFFQDVEEFPLDLCRSVTTRSRPHQWIDMLAIFAIEDLLDQLTDKCREDQIIMKSSDIVQQLVQWWASSGAPTSFLHIFYHKIRQELAGDPHQLMTLVQELINKLTALKLQSLLHEDVILGRFCVAPITYWPSVMRYVQLVVDWAPDLALRLTSVLDVQFGQERTDQFLRLVVHCHPELKDKSNDDKTQLRNILNTLIRYPWIKDRWMALIDQSLQQNSLEVEKSTWNSLSVSEIIETEMRILSQTDFSVVDILNTMRQDSESSKVIGNTSEMALLIKRIREKYKANGKEMNARKWTQKLKDPSDKALEARLEVDDFLAVACRVIHDEKGYVPRDVQLIAVAAFVSSDDQQQQTGQMPRRMGEISTGEGKTLISALVAIYHVLRHWNDDRHVNIITSSPVLAEANIAEIGWLFQAFGVSVSNNCDQKCSNDDEIRRERYNNDVIYGDLGSFMRDILLTRFFEDKDVTRNRNPGAIIVDEVDSMTLDKGENVLYMSHNIPEMYDLMRIFVEIWTTINAPDVVHLAESSDVVDEIRQLIEPRISDCVPNGMQKFAERHLPTWIRSAFRACYLLQPNDA